MSPERARNVQAAFARFSLSAVDLAGLLRLWANRGGTSREYVDGTIELLINGNRITRGRPEHIEEQLRVRLARVDPLTLVLA